MVKYVFPLRRPPSRIQAMHIHLARAWYAFPKRRNTASKSYGKCAITSNCLVFLVNDAVLYARYTTSPGRLRFNQTHNNSEGKSVDDPTSLATVNEHAKSTNGSYTGGSITSPTRSTPPSTYTTR